MAKRRSDPDLAYHYQPLRDAVMMGWLKRAVLHDQIYFSSPASFNDPFDSSSTPDSHAITLWVEAQAYRMVIAGMQQREVARVITEMGRGLQAGRLEGIEYPADYKISQRGVMQAFRRYCWRHPPPGLAEMRRVDTQRCEDMYRALLPTIMKGCREGAMATDAATRALAHKARINGMDAPIKVAAVDSRGRDLLQIPIETVHRIMEGGEVVFDAEPQKMIEDKDE